MLKHNNISVDVEEFASEYVREDALFERPYNKRNKYKVLEAYHRIALRCDIAPGVVPGLEKQFRSYVARKMDALVRCGVRNMEELPSQLAWLKQAVDAIGVLPDILKEHGVEEVSAEHVDRSERGLMRALGTQALVRGSDADADMYELVCARLRLDCSPDELRATWEKYKRLALEDMLVSATHGDSIAEAMDPDVAALVDVVLLSDMGDADVLSAEVLGADVLGGEDVALAQAQGLSELWQLVQKYKLEEAERDAVQRWSRAYYEYIAQGRSVSIVLLQRRWHALKGRARYKVHNYWRTTAQQAQAGGRARQPACSHPPRELHIAILKRYPHVAVSPMATWRELVERGYVITEPLPQDDMRLAPPPPPPPPSLPGEPTGSDNTETRRHTESDDDTDGPIANRNVPRVRRRRGALPTPPLPPCSPRRPPLPPPRTYRSPRPSPPTSSPSPAPRDLRPPSPERALRPPTPPPARVVPLAALRVTPNGLTTLTHNRKLYILERVDPVQGPSSSNANQTVESVQPENRKRTAEADTDSARDNGPDTPLLKQIKSEPEHDIECIDTYSSNVPCVVKTESDVTQHTLNNIKQETQDEIETEPNGNRNTDDANNQSEPTTSGDSQDVKCDVAVLIKEEPRSMGDRIVFADDDDVSEVDLLSDDDTFDVKLLMNSYLPLSRVAIDPSLDSRVENDPSGDNQPYVEIEIDDASEIKTESGSDADSDAGNDADSDAGNDADSDAGNDADSDAETNQHLVEIATPGVDVRPDECGGGVTVRRRTRVSLALRSLAHEPAQRAAQRAARRPVQRPALVYRMGVNRVNETCSNKSRSAGQAGQTQGMLTIPLLHLLLVELSDVAMATAHLERTRRSCCSARSHRDVSEARARLRLPPPPPHVHADGAECSCCCRLRGGARGRPVVTAERKLLSKSIAAMLKEPY